MLRIALLLLIASVCSIIGLRRWFLVPQLASRKEKASCTALALYQHLLGKQLNITTGSKLNVSDNTLTLPKENAQSKGLSDLAEVIISTGLIAAGQYEGRWLKRTQSLLLSCQLIPLFALIASLFGLLAGTVPLRMSLFLLSLASLYTSGTLLYLCFIRAKAANVMKERALRFILTKGGINEAALLRVLRAQPFFILRHYPIVRQK